VPTATVNGIKIDYVTEGKGPAFAMIHGGFGGAGTSVLPRVPDTTVTPFTDAYTTITYDRRSSGQSDYPEGEHTLEMKAADLRELLRHLNIFKAFIMGTSAGGSIAVTYALNYPETVLALIPTSTSVNLLHDLQPEFPDGIRRRADCLRCEGPEAAYAMIQREQQDPKWFLVVGKKEGAVPPTQEVASNFAINRGPNTPPVAPAMLERMQKVQAAFAKLTHQQKVRYLIGELRNLSAYVGADLRPRLKEIKAPTLVLHAEGDPLVTVSAARDIAKGISGAELVIVPGVGHGIPTMEGSIPPLRKFLDRVVGAPAGARR
jgi:pimeloyl-ACP methyl ester carboxylesterase